MNNQVDPHPSDPSARRDHRDLGRELEFFTVVDAVGPGHVIWPPAGATIRRELMRWIEGDDLCPVAVPTIIGRLSAQRDARALDLTSTD